MGKQNIKANIAKHREALEKMALDIWAKPEAGFREFNATKLQQDYLKNMGAKITSPVDVVETAFIAEYGSGKPIIGILGEFDALPGLSQKAGLTVQDPLEPGAYGHACGHNLLGTAGVLAFAALMDTMKEENLPGTLRFYACPAEENLSGKSYMARAGVFNDLDCCLTYHPGNQDAVSGGSNNAYTLMEFYFKGIPAHAGGAPWLGRSALDAVELMNVGCNYLREHMIDAARIHYAYSDPGGTAPNVVQSHAVIKYEVRAPKVSQVQELFTRVVDVARGAALMTGTKMKYEITMAFSDYVPNRTLGAVVDQCMRELGAPEWTEPDYRLAAEFLRTYPRTTMVGIREKLGYYFEPEELDAALEKPLDRIIHPFNPKETAYSSGSTDVGDVGYATPTVMFHVATACLGNVGHSWQNTAFACSDIGMKGMLRAAEIMTLAAIRTMDQPEVIAKAREELKQKNGGSYHCPLPDYVTPPIGRY